MAKPSVTTRTTKGAALTYAELDSNFTNLKDATLTLTANTAGTQVVADLNGNITLVAGTNITLTGDNGAKTITITATGSSGLAIDGSSGDYECAADIDLNGYFIRSDGTNIKVSDDIQFPDGAGPFVPGSGTLLLRVGTGGTIELQANTVEFSSANTGTPSNTTTPTTYLQVVVNNSTRYIPLYT
jgi:hypothetical protein